MNTTIDNRSMPPYRAELVRAQARDFKQLCRKGGRAIMRADAHLARLRRELGRLLANHPDLVSALETICARADAEISDQIYRAAIDQAGGNHERVL